VNSRPMHDATPVEVPGRWDALLEPGVRAKLERVLPAYITARRWYRTKTKRVQSARVVAAFPMSFPLVMDGTSKGAATSARVTLLELTLEDGARDIYVLPLTFVAGEDAARLRARRSHAFVLPLQVTSMSARARPSSGFVVDALAVEGFLASWLDAVARGGVIEDSGLALHFHPLPVLQRATKEVGLRDVEPKPLDAEQTNTSMIYGDRFVGKVIRKLDPGESPDLEVGRVLTAAGYEHAPLLGGWVDVRPVRAPDAEPSTLGLVHAFVPNRGDAWRHVLEVLDGWLTSAAQRDGAPPRLEGDLLTRSAEALPFDAAAATGDSTELAALLGRRVGEMHVALASAAGDPRFLPAPLDIETRTRIAREISRDLERALTHAGAGTTRLGAGARDAFEAVRLRERALEARLEAAVRLGEGTIRMRVHGDLHLGQVLFTGNDFVIIDFEGEPARSLEERKSKRSPLVDVAGMLRSFHYAIVSAVRARPEASRAAIAPWATFWYRAVTASFLRGWLGAVEGTIVLPASRIVTHALLDLYLLEKSVYEVGYELDNRPDWVEIPLQGIRELLENEPPSAEPRAVPAAAGPSTPSVSVEPPAIDPRSPAVIAFAHGKATHAHALLGAHPRMDGTTDFAVWAPNASRVDVIGDFDAWSGTPLVRIEGAERSGATESRSEGSADHAPRGAGATGIFAARVRGARPGQRYKFRITSGGRTFDKADPFGFSTEGAPGNASVIATFDHEWGDAGWMSTRAEHARLDRPMSIYEVHLGSWRRVPEEGNRFLTYREIAAPLAAYAKEMGFTHVEIMPVLEHPFYGSWGYAATGFFAPTSRYGTPADLMYLVDTLHQAGLGVIFDWVPAHFARDEHGLVDFDGGPTFEPSDASRAVHPTWNTGLFDFSRPEVRSFLLSSATFWIEQFHADGLRVDGVESIIYRDHQRAPGTWTPNELGGRENLEGIEFLRELTGTLKLEHPDIVLAAEDSSAWPGVTRGAAHGGLGFDLKWDMGFSHDMRRYLATEPIERSRHQGVLTFRSIYAANEAYVLPLSHDDVIAERGGSLLQQMNGDPWQRLANLRLLYAMTWLQAGKKLLFMGDELAQWEPWHHDRSLDWHLAQEKDHAGIARMIGDLNRVYRETPALYLGDASPNGFEWIDGSNAAMSVITFLRKSGTSSDDMVVVACNFTPVPRHQYRIGVPRAGRYRELFNSDAADYGGSGHGNMGGVDAVPYPWNGRPSSIVVTLPPLGIIALGR